MQHTHNQSEEELIKRLEEVDMLHCKELFKAMILKQQTAK